MYKENEITIDKNLCIMNLYNRSGEKIRETIFDKLFLSIVKNFRGSSKNKKDAFKARELYKIKHKL